MIIDMLTISQQLITSSSLVLYILFSDKKSLIFFVNNYSIFQKHFSKEKQIFFLIFFLQPIMIFNISYSLFHCTLYKIPTSDKIYMYQGEPDLTISMVRDQFSFFTYRPNPNKVLMSELVDNNLQEIEACKRDHALQRMITDCLISWLNSNNNYSLEEAMASLAEAVIRFCDEAGQIHQLDKMVYLSLRYYQARGRMLDSRKQGHPNKKGCFNSMLADILGDASKLFHADLASYQSKQSGQQKADKEPISIKARASALKNTGFAGSAVKNNSQSYNNLNSNNRFFDLAKALQDYELIELYEKIQNYEFIWSQQSSSLFIQKSVQTPVAFLKKILMRRILWNEKKLQNQITNAISSSSNIQEKSKPETAKFNQLNTMLKKSLEKEASTENFSQTLPINIEGNQWQKKIIQEILEIVSLCTSVLIGNTRKMSEFAGNNFYLFLKLAYFYAEQSLDFKNIEEHAISYWNSQFPNKQKLPTQHTYILSLLSDKNYHRSYQILKSLLHKNPNHRYYLEFLGCLAFHLEVPKVYVKYFDPEYYLNMMPRLIMASIYEEQDEEQEEQVPKLLINTASILQNFFLPKYNSQQILDSSQGTSQCLNNYNELIELLLTKYLRQKPISQFKQLHWLANLTSCAMNARVIPLLLPFYQRLVQRHLVQGLDEYGLEVIGIELCACSSQIQEDLEDVQDEYEPENKKFRNQQRKEQQNSVLKGYLFDKYQLDEDQGKQNNESQEIPYPFNLTKTFTIFKEQYLTKQTFSRPFDYCLLDKVNQMTDSKSLLHQKNPQIALIFRNYFKNYFALSQIKKLSYDFNQSIPDELVEQILSESEQFKNLCSNLIKREQMLLAITQVKNSPADCGEILRTIKETLKDYYFLENIKINVSNQQSISELFQKLYKISMDLIGSTRTYINYLEKNSVDFPFLWEIKSEIY